MGKAKVKGLQMDAQREIKKEIYLRPWNLFSVRGKLSYGESYHAWNTLRLKREILAEFPDMKDQLTRLFYKITFVKDFDSLFDVVEKLKETGGPIPLLMWFYKEEVL